MKRRWQEKKLISALAVFTHIFCFADMAAAEEQLTLFGCVQMILQKNRAIEQAAEERDVARWSISEARRSAGPIVSWQMSGNKNNRSGGGSEAGGRKIS